MFILPVVKDHLSWETTKLSGRFIHVLLYLKKIWQSLFNSNANWLICDQSSILTADWILFVKSKFATKAWMHQSNVWCFTFVYCPDLLDCVNTTNLKLPLTGPLKLTKLINSLSAKCDPVVGQYHWLINKLNIIVKYHIHIPCDIDFNMKIYFLYITNDI